MVNFGFPSYGRNLHWLIARELLENREVRTLVLEVFENESRKAHPFFANVAEVSDVLQAPMLINRVAFAGKHALEKTSSGKKRRKAIRERFVRQELELI